MTILVGVDIQPLDEVVESLNTFGNRYTDRIFTKRELEQSDSEASGLAADFAAKEAMLKILDTRATVPPWKSIEVWLEKRRRPRVVLHGEAAMLARVQGVTDVWLSLSHGVEVASAVVVAQITETRGSATP